MAEGFTPGSIGRPQQDAGISSPESPDAVISSPESNLDSFLFETKYVMLNFMSLLPPDIYARHACISVSPGSSTSDMSVSGQSGDKFFKASRSSLRKARSLDVSPAPYHPPRLKYLGKLKSMQEADSPQSEDNLSYRYQKNINRGHMRGDSKDFESPRHEFQGTDATQSVSAPDIYDASGSISPRKAPSSLYRMHSDISSSGDFSYNSDADDEYDEFSNASSLFSMRSARLREGFLDLRKVPARLSTVASESEMERCIDMVDGLPDTVSNTEADLESQGLKQVSSNSSNSPRTPRGPREPGSPEDRTLYRIASEQDKDEMYTPEGTLASGDVRRASSADRSKLKLDIPCPSELVQIDDILVSLQTELNSEMSELETEFEDALRSARAEMKNSPRRTPLTPQTEAARILARIGDEVKEQYGAQISSAVRNAFFYQLKEMTYEQFKDMAKDIIDDTLPGWRQVALLMVFAQKMVWNAVENGQKQFSNLVDFSSRLVADVAADFIIKQGGWEAVMNFDPSQSSDTQSGTSPEMLSETLDFFDHHNETQVDNKKGNSEETKVAGSLLDTPGSTFNEGASLGFSISQDNTEGLEEADGCSQELRDLMSPDGAGDVFPEFPMLSHEENSPPGDSDLLESEDTCTQTEDESTVVETDTGSHGDRTWDLLSHVRQSGLKIAAISLAIVAVSIGIRIAALSKYYQSVKQFGS